MCNHNYSDIIQDLCEKRCNTSCTGSNHAACLVPPGKRYCFLSLKGDDLWGE